MEPFLSKLTRKHKEKLYARLKEKMAENYEAIVKSATAAHDGATHEDAVAKSKYDTHGLELSYLAGSQYERAEKLKSELIAMEEIAIQYFEEDDSVQHGAAVELLNSSTGQQKIVFLLKYGAGVITTWEGKNVQVISPQTPMGEAILDAYVGDEIQIGNGKDQTYEIVALI